MNIELLNSEKNKELLLSAVYSMIGVHLDKNEREEKRYFEIYEDLILLLHDVTTDFMKKDLSFVNRHIALRMFQLYESREEKKVLEERRKTELSLLITSNANDWVYSDEKVEPFFTLATEPQHVDTRIVKSELVLPERSSYVLGVSDNEKEDILQTPRSFFTS
jgi:hypothetical protein